MRVFFDTSILFDYCLWRYLNKDIDKYVLDIFEKALNGDFELIISDFSILELVNYLNNIGIKSELIDIVIKEIENSNEISFVKIDTMHEEYIKWVKEYIKLGFDLGDAQVLRIAQDCGCTFFITNDKNILNKSIYFKNNNLLDMGFSIISIHEFNEIVLNNIDSKVIKRHNDIQTNVTDYFLKQGYNTINIREVGPFKEYDLILNKDKENIGIEIKSNFSTKISGSIVTNFLNKKDDFKKYIISTSGFSDEAIKIAEKSKGKIELIDFYDITHKKIKKLNIIMPSRKKPLSLTIKPNLLHSIWTEMQKETTNKNDKGKLLEDWTENMLKIIEGFKIKKRDVRTDVEEIDFIVANHSPHPFWEKRCDPILVECKNWSKKIGSGEVKIFSQTLDDRKIEDGILISVKGITGNKFKDAKKFILNQVIKGRHIMVLQEPDLLEINDGINPTDKISEKFYELFA